jgi:hypothetical protein
MRTQAGVHYERPGGGDGGGGGGGRSDTMVRGDRSVATEAAPPASTWAPSDDSDGRALPPMAPDVVSFATLSTTPPTPVGPKRPVN